jgi:tellurite resistance protein
VSYRSLALASVLALAALACGTVAPYERSRLMRRSMQAKPALDAAFDTHVVELRESAIGASSGENASCGCR